MNGELLAIVEQIERDKGVKKEILIQAIESALASAARKVVGSETKEEIAVQLDRETGKIKVLEKGKEITSRDFGRIAAQTAKQVIIQKIREAEKEVIFDEFQNKAGEIVSGGVYRFDKGNIIVDLGKTEGFIPKSEQSGKEQFRQGQRVRAYVLEVKKETRGPQIVLSRTHPNLVRKLFELEVPEIYEGIVEIKSIARQSGDRTKIAVYSKDEKIDSVGACVGMRGQRVKNIVTELNGEKIDIVRYSENTVDFISSALSPAEILEIKIDKDNKRAEVIVADDQLSLTIGKKGQNVRLASILTGWELDIRTKEQVKESRPVKTLPQEKADLSQLEGVGQKMAVSLNEAGFDSMERIANADIEELTKIKGLGKKKAESIIKQAKALLGTPSKDRKSKS